jgi:hypothetical protein
MATTAHDLYDTLSLGHVTTPTSPIDDRAR